MSTLSQQDPMSSGGPPQYKSFKTGVSRYEKYFSVMWAGIVLVGLATAMLLLMWLTTLSWSVTKEPSFIEEPMGNNNNPEGIAEDFEEPGVEELADVAEPQLADAVEALTSDPSSQAAAVEAVNGNKTKMGTGKGLGDARQAGPGNGGTGTDNPANRWNVQYTTSSRDLYFKQLQAFGIELGAVHPTSGLIEYASNLTAAKPSKRTGDRKSEGRMSFRYKKGFRLQLWDIDKLTAAGVNTKERILLHYYPPKTTQKLLALEKAKIGSADVSSIKKTTFGVSAKGSGFEYYVKGDIVYK